MGCCCRSEGGIWCCHCCSMGCVMTLRLQALTLVPRPTVITVLVPLTLVLALLELTTGMMTPRQRQRQPQPHWGHGGWSYRDEECLRPKHFLTQSFDVLLFQTSGYYTLSHCLLQGEMQHGQQHSWIIYACPHSSSQAEGPCSPCPCMAATMG